VKNEFIGKFLFNRVVVRLCWIGSKVKRHMPVFGFLQWMEISLRYFLFVTINVQFHLTSYREVPSGLKHVNFNLYFLSYVVLSLSYF